MEQKSPGREKMTEEERKEELIQKITELEMVKKELAGRKYSSDLFTFNTQVLHVAEGGELAPFHKEMCDFVMNTESKRKLLLVPRGHLKSTMVTVGYSLMRIAQNPNIRILIANATYEMACTFLNQIKKHLRDNPTFKELYGDLATNAEKWAENAILIPSEGNFAKKENTIVAFGIGGNLTSQHYDLIIMDDVVNRDMINTPEQIQKTILFYKDALDLLDNQEKSEVLIIGTRWHQSDLYGWIMDKANPQEVWKSFSTFIRPAYTGDLELDKDLVLLFPQKFTREALLSLKRDKGPYEFSSQYMNDCVPEEDAKFKRSWFNVVLEDELRWRNITYYAMVDPAIGQTKDSDRTAMVVIGVDEFNNWFVRDIVLDRMLPNDIVKNIFYLWEQYHPRTIGVEMVAFQKSLKYAITDEMRKRNIFLPIEELKADKSKNERIEGMIPRYANGAVFHLQGCPYRDILEEEMMWYPRGKHDDVIDALSYGLQIAHQSKRKLTRRGEGGDPEDRKSHRYIY